MPDFEVAISFRAENEAFALQLKAALDPPLATFVYSKAQERLAGRDGLEAFAQTFKDNCRLVVVLYRAGWGATAWTRAEESAIKDRCLHGDGWSHLLVVRMDRSPLPAWLPATNLYFDQAAFPMTALIATVRAKCAELGAELRPPSAAEIARAGAERERFDAETDHLMVMSNAFQPQYQALCAEVATKAQEVGEASGRGIVAGPGQSGSFVVFDSRVTLQLACPLTLPRDLQDATVRAALLRGRLLTVAEMERSLMVASGTQPLEDTLLRLKRIPGMEWCWEMGRQTLPAAETADALLRWLLEARQRAMRDPVL